MSPMLSRHLMVPCCQGRRPGRVGCALTSSGCAIAGYMCARKALPCSTKRAYPSTATTADPPPPAIDLLLAASGFALGRLDQRPELIAAARPAACGWRPGLV